jgi:hypothetical protein
MRVTKMTRRATFFCGAVLAGLLLLAAPARAQTDSSTADDDYAALCEGLTVDPPSVAPDSDVTVSGRAASPNATIQILVNEELNTTTTSDANRFFSVVIHIPADASGTIAIRSQQVGDNTDPVVGCDPQVGSLEIIAPTAAPLARTGSNSTLPLVRLGFALLAAGGLVILVSRRRKGAEVAA